MSYAYFVEINGVTLSSLTDAGVFCEELARIKVILSLQLLSSNAGARPGCWLGAISDVVAVSGMTGSSGCVLG